VGSMIAVQGSSTATGSTITATSITIVLPHVDGGHRGQRGRVHRG
jgi:hypothetical protein